MKQSESTKSEEMPDTGLSASQEMLLQAFIDEECGPWGRYRARRLMSQSDAARMFVARSCEVSAQARSFFAWESGTAMPGGGGLDIWDKVQNRIAQEERSGILLGQRQNAGRQAHGIFDYSLLDFIRLGGMGAAVTAALGFALILLKPGSSQPTANGFRIAAVSPQAAANPMFEEAGLSSMPMGNTVALDNSETSEPYYSIVPRIQNRPRAMEVDWMRSRGRVHVIQHPEDRSAIFWVKRGGDQVYARAPEVGLFSESSSQGRQSIKVLDDNLPSAVTVMSR